MQNKRILNWRRDRPDFRDKKFKLIPVAPIPEVPLVDLRPLCPPIYEQNQIGSCTSQAWTRLIEFIELMDLRGKQAGPEVFAPAYTPLSRLFFYYNERLIDGDPDSDNGSELRSGQLAASTYGVCEESQWPYLDNNALVKPPQPCYDTAVNHKILTGYSIGQNNLYQMKQCLLQGYPFVFGISVYDSFMSDEVASSGIVPMPQPNEQYQGGHAVCCAGFDSTKKVMICANSWGTNWGIAGYFMLPFDYITNGGLSSDFWTARK
jgi:C1A family cysteine protease